MPPSFSNPFTKKERERKAKERAAIEAQQRQLKQLQEHTKAVARQINGPKGPEAGRGPQVPAHVDPTTLLSKGQDQLLRIRDLHPSDLEAFPLLNEAQRIAQQLRDALNRMPEAGREIWQFQIKEMEDEIQGQTERIMAGAAALPAAPENPRNQARSSSSSGPKPPAASKSPFRQVMSAFPLSTATRPVQQRPNVQAQRAGSTQASTSGTRGHRRGYQPPGVDDNSTQGAAHSSYAGQQQPMIQPYAAQYAKTLPPGGAQLAGNPAMGAAPGTIPFAAQQFNPSLAAAPASSGMPQVRNQPVTPTQQLNTWAPKPGALGIQRQPSAQGIQARQSEDDIFSGLQLGGTPTVAQTAPSALEPSRSQGAAPSSPWSIPSSSPRNTPQPATAIQHEQQQAQEAGGVGPQGPRPFHAPAAGNLGMAPDASTVVNKTAELMSKGLSFSMARRLSGNTRTSSSNSSSSASHWSAGMTAAAAAAYAAQSGVSLNELATKKVIKKKTRGVKVGYGQEEEEAPVEVSHVIPGQPMPGPQYLAQARQQQEQMQAQAVQLPAASSPGPAGSTGSEQFHLQDPHVQALIAQRQAIFQAHQAVMTQPPQQQQQLASTLPALQQQQRASPVWGSTTGTPTAAATLTQQQHLVLSPRSPAATAQAVSPVGSAAWPGSPQAAAAVVHQQGLGQAHSAQAAPDPPVFVIQSQDPLQDLNVYLNQLTGPLHSCQQAATVAAATIVQTLSGTARDALAQHLMISERSRLTLQQMSALTTQLTQLEEQQAQRVAQEEFEVAATLDVQIKETGQQLDGLQATLRQMRTLASQLCERHTTLLNMQAEACTTVSAYLTKLGDNHTRLLEQMSDVAQQESSQAGAAHAKASAAIDDARMSLAQHKMQLAAALEELDARQAAATAELQIERNEISAKQMLLQSEVQQLRAALAEREGALQASVSALQQVDMRIQAAAYQLVEAKQQLQAKQQQLQDQEQLLEQQSAQAQVLQASSTHKVAGRFAHNQALIEQGTVLQEAAQRLQGMAARISTRVALDRQAVEEREQLRQMADQAHDVLQEHIKRLADCDAQQANYNAAVARAQAQLSQLQAAASTASSSLPSLSAAKDSAAAARDFKEAARLHTQIKSIQQQVDTLQAQAQQADAMVGKLRTRAQSGQQELSALMADDQRVRRDAAFTRFRYLVVAARSHSRQMQGAGITQELLQALKAEVELETAEAQQLQNVWGFTDVQPDSHSAISIVPQQQAVPPSSLAPGSHTSAVGDDGQKVQSGTVSPRACASSAEQGGGAGPETSLSQNASQPGSPTQGSAHQDEDEAFSTPREGHCSTASAGTPALDSSPSHQTWQSHQNVLYDQDSSPMR